MYTALTTDSMSSILSLKNKDEIDKYWENISWWDRFWYSVEEFGSFFINYVPSLASRLGLMVLLMILVEGFMYVQV